MDGLDSHDRRNASFGVYCKRFSIGEFATDGFHRMLDRWHEHFPAQHRLSPDAHVETKSVKGKGCLQRRQCPTESDKAAILVSIGDKTAFDFRPKLGHCLASVIIVHIALPIGGAFLLFPVKKAVPLPFFLIEAARLQQGEEYFQEGLSQSPAGLSMHGEKEAQSCPCIEGD